MNAPCRFGLLASLLAAALTAQIPAAASAPQAAGPLTIEQMQEQLTKLDGEISMLMPTAKVLADADFRTKEGPKLRVLLAQTADLMGREQKAMEADERLKEAPDLIDAIRAARFHTMAYAAALGDTASMASLTRIAGEKGADALPAASGLTLAKWIDASTDASVQQKLLENFSPLVKAHAQDDAMLDSLQLMMNLGPANEEVKKQVSQIIRTEMKSPETPLIISKLDDLEAQKAMVGQTLAISGRTVTGGSFNVTQYKGKVVLIDFWATWCPPCVAEVPAIKAAYEKFHDKGFEVVGVSCDQDDDTLKNFIRDHQMPWIQLHETTQSAEDNLHPLARRYRVMAIPGMFLLDRQGILRYVNAEDDLEKKIGELLAAPTPAPAP